ncbi:nucleotidyltransferase [Candidatus Pacearchaeota archaeon]|nr:nucleotidyltransferase [Candidatus Pacearchaeota archaeon]
MEEKKRIDMKEQEDLFNLIGKTLKKKVECYVVGGTAMMFLNLKKTTKDIDIVFKETEDYETFRETLISLGAKESKFKIENRQKVSSMLDLGEARFDLFLDYLIYFKLTPTIIFRVREVHEFFNMIVKVVSPEDIILFKSMADRESDRIDVSDIIKKMNLNWSVILEETELQTKNSEYFFSAFLYNFLLGLKEDFKTEIPREFTKKLEKLTEKVLIATRERLKSKEKNGRKKRN